MFDREFDIFDEWGNKIGRFIPADPSAGLAGCLAYIFAVILFAILAVLIGIPFWLLVKGWEKWKEGNKALAILAWGGTATILLVYIAPFWSSHQLALARQRTAQEQRIAKETATTETINSLEIVSITGGLLDSGWWGEDWNFSITLRNNGEYPIAIHSISDYPPPYDSVYGCQGDDEPGSTSLYWLSRFQVNGRGEYYKVRPGETVNFSCILETPYQEVYTDTIYLRVIVYEKTPQDSWPDEIGRGLLEIDA